jgi:GAF domain-containing protein
MQDPKPNPFTRETLPSEVLEEWQRLIDSMAMQFGVPAGLITRVDRDQIEILLSSATEGNPYTAGYVAQYPRSGWYCEHTLGKQALNLIPDASRDAQWRDNAAVTKLGIVSYMGMPIQLPDGSEFGTVCFLDNKSNAHNALHVKMLEHVVRMLELSLRLLEAEQEIARQRNVIGELSRVFPVCGDCGRVRNDSGEWIDAAQYVRNAADALPARGKCPQCARTVAPEHAARRTR